MIFFLNFYLALFKSEKKNIESNNVRKIKTKQFDKTINNMLYLKNQ